MGFGDPVLVPSSYKTSPVSDWRTRTRFGFRILGVFQLRSLLIYIARNFLGFDPWGHGFVREEEVVRTLRYINVLLLA